MASGIASALPFEDFEQVIGGSAPANDVIISNNQVNIWCNGTAGNILVTTRAGNDRVLQIAVGQSISLKLNKIRAGAGNTARGVYVGLKGISA